MEYFILPENLPKGGYFWETCIYAVSGYRAYNYKIFTTLTYSGGTRN